MKLTDIVVQKIIERLLDGEDYRVEILTLINAQFLQYAIEFFGKVVDAKLKNQGIDGDWYKREFLDPSQNTNDMLINSGLNVKSMRNTYNTTKRSKVLEIAPLHYDELYQSINTLLEQNNEIDITLTLKFRGVSVDLSINESLIVINTLAVKRAQLRGGAWSTAGKRVEKYLMMTLCELYNVPKENYLLSSQSEQNREIDFILLDAMGNRYFCEVKLMGRGNPESADAVIARDSRIFVADTLSDLNEEQLTARNVHWVALRSKAGFRKFFQILTLLNIPCQDFKGNIDQELPIIFEKLFPKDHQIIADESLDEEIGE